MSETKVTTDATAPSGIGYRRPDIQMMDGLQNVVSGMGTPEKDKSFNTFFGMGLMPREQLDAAYRGDWISRKAVDIPAYDATREWREWQADGKDVTRLETVEKDLGVQLKVMSALVRARLYGGAGLVLGVNDGKEPSEEIDLNALDRDCLQFIHVVSRYDLTPGPTEWDVMSPYYGEPTYYQHAGSTSQVMLHPSRVVRFLGAEIPDINLANGWGDSILQAVSDAILGAGTVTSSTAQMVAEAKLDVIKIPGLSQNIINADYEARLKKRFGFANTVKSVYSLLLLDKEEEWQRINSQFAGMPEILKMFLMMACGAVDIPATRFLGQSPSGLSATGDSDTRNYYDRVTTEQKVIMQPRIVRMDEVLMRSALGRMPARGVGDKSEVFYNWRPLWQLTDAEKADIATKKATVAKTDHDMGLINEVVLKKAREAQLINDGTYPGLEALIEEFDDDPDLENQPDAPTPPVITDPSDPAYDPKLDPNSPEYVPVNEDPEAVAQGEQAGGLPPPGKPKQIGKKTATDAMAQRIRDATSEPRPLYVRRDLSAKSQRAVKAWAKANGFETTLDDMHVTITYSKVPVDWLKMGGEGWSGSELTVSAGGPRVMQAFGSAVVLSFSNTELAWRHEDMVRNGASYDHDDYTPHVTISYRAQGLIEGIRDMKPFTGELVFGPEIFEAIDGSFDNDTDVKES